MKFHDDSCLHRSFVCASIDSNIRIPSRSRIKRLCISVYFASRSENGTPFPVVGPESKVLFKTNPTGITTTNKAVPLLSSLP